MANVQKARKGDLPSLRHIIRNSGVFNDEEQAVAIELVEAALNKEQEDKDYKLLTATRDGGSVVGYICYGPTPMTEGTWDVYWIIVSARNRGRGLGRELLRGTEAAIRKQGGKRVIIDTSTQTSYLAARALYESCGYRAVATVPNYYKTRWHRVTFYKKL
jgi:ribosomal protein S18 acetylase RimI-like enzyme